MLRCVQSRVTCIVEGILMAKSRETSQMHCSNCSKFAQVLYLRRLLHLKVTPELHQRQSETLWAIPTTKLLFRPERVRFLLARPSTEGENSGTRGYDCLRGRTHRRVSRYVQ
mmetsp:Transcript_7896/g.20902  ORF Transcript_7896/g.20902 Transcript_7896/m.20902 type:complete len:112 (-) Transcript_7896:395-730(-)